MRALGGVESNITPVFGQKGLEKETTTASGANWKPTGEGLVGLGVVRGLRREERKKEKRLKMVSK